MLDKLRALKEEYSQEGEGDPEFFAQINDLEKHLLHRESSP
jgi:hypothetical protein